MKNASLANLNFREIVDYDGQPLVKNRYVEPLTCRGYCVDCEESGILNATGGHLDLMSHGCDSADYEAILGPMPRTGQGISAPILFLLEAPGSDERYCNGQPVAFRGLNKKPPVNHYYWSPRGQGWPTRISEFVGDSEYYGRYFAYLMQRHVLLNVYITNVVKCRWISDASDGKGKQIAPAITQHCAGRHLKRELEIFAPRIAICFGGNATKGFQTYSITSGCSATRLYHPSFIKDRSQVDRKKRTKEELFGENDRLVEKALAKLASFESADPTG